MFYPRPRGAMNLHPSSGFSHSKSEGRRPPRCDGRIVLHFRVFPRTSTTINPKTSRTCVRIDSKVPGGSLSKFIRPFPSISCLL
jgi:hypothetical protein